MFHVALKLRLVDLTSTLNVIGFFQLSDNKLSDDNLASELMEIGVFKPMTIEEIVIFMIRSDIQTPPRS